MITPSRVKASADPQAKSIKPTDDIVATKLPPIPYLTGMDSMGESWLHFALLLGKLSDMK